MSESGVGSLIVGLGKTGLSVARFLHRRQISFSVTDSREHPPQSAEFQKSFPDASLHLGRFDESDFLAADEIVISPGVSLTTPQVQAAIKAGVPVYGDVELFARYVDPARTVVAITGSNGKSTVTALVTEMARRAGLRAVSGANFGEPALNLLDDSEPADVYVLELSSFQLETTDTLKPAASVVLNISADHLDRYASYDDYLKAKLRVHRHSRCIVVNRESVETQKPDVSAPVISFGLKAGEPGHFGILRHNNQDYIAYGDEDWISCEALSGLPGRGGVLNAQAALALGYAIGLPKAKMLEVLREFESLPHRMQDLGRFRGVRWINDSKATNVGATQMALSSMVYPCVWIAGGDGKGADFKELAELIRAKVLAAFLFGKDKEKIAAAISDVSDVPVETFVVDDLQAAVRGAYEYAPDCSCVLFSPACASLDMYRDYIERGNHFIKLFKELSDA